MEESKRRKCCRDFPSLNNIISTSQNGSPDSSPAIYLFILMPDTIPWAVWTLAPLPLSLSPNFNLTIIIIGLCITPGLMSEVLLLYTTVGLLHERILPSGL